MTTYPIKKGGKVQGFRQRGGAPTQKATGTVINRYSDEELMEALTGVKAPRKPEPRPVADAGELFREPTETVRSRFERVVEGADGEEHQGLLLDKKDHCLGIVVDLAKWKKDMPSVAALVEKGHLVATIQNGAIAHSSLSRLKEVKIGYNHYDAALVNKIIDVLYTPGDGGLRLYGNPDTTAPLVAQNGLGETMLLAHLTPPDMRTNDIPSHDRKDISQIAGVIT